MSVGSNCSANELNKEEEAAVKTILDHALDFNHKQ